MLQEITTVIKKGDSSGNEMLLRFRLPSGLDIFGLPTQNRYGGGWDLGPTWNYLVLADPPFLLDAGRFNQTEDILGMMRKVGFDPSDLGFILLSHGHEDHDGGVAALAQQTGATIRVHPVYERMIRVSPQACPTDAHREYPAKCWNCFMPQDFVSKNCLAYHKANSRMTVIPVDEDPCELMPGVTTYATPGHSPDSLSTVINNEAILVGDTILPEISPWPTTLQLYDRIAGVLDGWDPKTIFGLNAYIRSLHKLKQIGIEAGPLWVLPAHRLYYRDVWNDLDLVGRIDALFEHHRNRCAAILNILQSSAMQAEEIALQLFPEHLLKGPGKRMAANEIVSHLELMASTGDITVDKSGGFIATGRSSFEAFIQDPAQLNATQLKEKRPS